MNLKEFVSETIVQIIEGVIDANDRTKQYGAVVSPNIAGSQEHGAKHGFVASKDGAAQMIHFDVALEAKEGTGTKGGIGVVTGIFSLGSAGQSSAESSTVSRVKFGVPIVLPGEHRKTAPLLSCEMQSGADLPG